MNTHARLTMDRASFMEWITRQECRHELKRGVVMMMAGASRDHARVSFGLARAFSTRLDVARWDIAAGDFAVEIGEDIRYPDVVVEHRAERGQALSTSQPIIVAEVLSPSSIALDMNIKAGEYMSLASLETYIVAAQDEARLWVWNRGTDTARPWPKEPLEVFGTSEMVPLPCLGLELPMAEIYAAVAPRAPG